MTTRKAGYRYRITLDRNTLIIDRVCVRGGEDEWTGSDTVVEELDGEQGLVHAIVSWLRPKRIYTDNCGAESVRLVRACKRLGIVVIRPSRHKARAERLYRLNRRGAMKI